MKDITYQETTDELNRRGYYQETVTTTPSVTITPVKAAPFMEKYGKLVWLGFIGVFLLAIFPGQED